MADFVTILGFIAASLTTFGYVPQIIKGYKTKHLKDVSLMMFVLLTIGMFLWMIYGILRKDIVIIIANIVGLVFGATTLGLKLYYKR
ncbi:lipid-A-disaccharide synthase N-terminal domain-containing protein [Candidatus Woesearchaeota archaeon]|nr:lipid-A-disaccharide synthase N-terminal domain-containing protein [Candidatus Woesearchaeota archaeon]